LGYGDKVPMKLINLNKKIDPFSDRYINPQLRFLSYSPQSGIIYDLLYDIEYFGEIYSYVIRKNIKNYHEID
jgi:hypothetical protein